MDILSWPVILARSLLELTARLVPTDLRSGWCRTGVSKVGQGGCLVKVDGVTQKEHGSEGGLHEEAKQCWYCQGSQANEF